MGPSKMEEDFRKKLNARELQPSEAAWDRLDAMLSVAENKKLKRAFPWRYVAAGLILFFGAGLFLFTQEPENLKVLPANDNSSIVSTQEALEQTESPKKGTTATVPSEVEQNMNKEVIAANQRPLEKKLSSMQVLNPSELPKQVVNEAKPLVLQSETPDHQKVTVEAEKLLVTVNQLKEKPKVKVNANSLLMSVEGELNQEFRETTFDKIQRKFEAVKTAVVNRNYE